MIKSLQGFRFIFILSIMLLHWGNPILGEGADLCSFFFVLSGFIVMANGGGMKNDVLIYIKKKAKKIYPLSFIALLIAIIFERLNVGIGIIPHLFLLQSWIPSKHTFFCYNSVAWFLSSMLFCYLFTPYLFRVFNRIKNKSIVLMFLLLSIALVETFVILLYPKNNAYTTWFIYINPGVRILEYIQGMCIGCIFSLIKIPLQKNNFLHSIIEIVFLLVYFLILHFKLLGHLSYLIHIPMILFFSLQLGIISKIFSYKLFQFLAGISFEMYMIHQSFIPLLNNYIANRYLNFTVFLLTSILIAYLIDLFLLYVKQIDYKQIGVRTDS